MAGSKIIEMKPSKLSMAKGGSRTVLAPKSPITFQNCEEIRARFDDYINQRKTEIILDLKSVPFIDSEGLELLVQMNEELRMRGGLLKIVGMNSGCKEILVATRLINNLNVYEDIHAAITGRL